MSKILVVDDDAELRQNLVDVLDGFGFATRMAVGGEEALASLAAEECDLVLLDLIMPGMGGMETLIAIRSRFPKTRVVMLTAFATIDNAVEAMRKGAEDYLAKPFRTDELLTTVRRILEEVRIKDCGALLNIDGTLSSLANAMRREIIRQIHREGSLRFMDLARAVGVEDHTKINFHLKTLKDAGLVQQNEARAYVLTADGTKIIECLNHLTQSLTS